MVLVTMANYPYLKCVEKNNEPYLYVG